MFNYYAKIIKIVDGDTVDVDIDLGLRIHSTQRLRLSGIDAPEPHTETREAGDAATAFLREMIPEGTSVVIKTFTTGKYGRWIADIWKWVDGSSGTAYLSYPTVNSQMIAHGHAVRS